MNIWIDFSNSPHPLLFAPVARRLEERGHSVLVTARDNAQTVQLTLAHWPAAAVIGSESPQGRVRKASALSHRIAALRRWGSLHRPDLALSHNSYSQIVAARMVRLPVVTAMDFEHQPANHLAFRLADAVLVPKIVPIEALRAKGVRDSKVHRYPGFKEEVYLGDFRPNGEVLNGLGIERDLDTAVVVIRTPPSRALYHRFDNPLFLDVLRVLGKQRQVRVVILPRHPEQARAIGDMGLPNAVIPKTAVDSRSLVYGADLVIGAGGTMTREAALMGIPTLSVYAGPPPAVDRALEEDGRLRRLTSLEQVAHVERRSAVPVAVERLRERGETIIGVLVRAIETFGPGKRTGDSTAPTLDSARHG